MKMFLWVVIAGLGVGVSGCASPPVDPVPVNTICPIMENQPLEPRATYVYEGQTIVFCCLQCIAKWKAYSEEERAVRFARAMEAR